MRRARRANCGTRRNEELIHCPRADTAGVGLCYMMFLGLFERHKTSLNVRFDMRSPDQKIPDLLMLESMSAEVRERRFAKLVSAGISYIPFNPNIMNVTGISSRNTHSRPSLTNYHVAEFTRSGGNVLGGKQFYFVRQRTNRFGQSIVCQPSV